LVNRDLIKEEFDSIFGSCGSLNKTNINDYLCKVFFCIDKGQAKDLRKLVEVMKKTILLININDFIDVRSFNQVYDPVEPDI